MNLIFLVLALLCAIVAALTGFDVLIHAEHILGWLGLALVFYFVSLLVGPALAWRRE